MLPRDRPPMSLSAVESICDSAELPGGSETQHGTMVVETPAQVLLNWLLDSLIVLPEEWDELSDRDRHLLQESESATDLVTRLVRLHLLTQFQADAILEESGEDL